MKYSRSINHCSRNCCQRVNQISRRLLVQGNFAKKHNRVTHILYRAGYKYQLTAPYVLQTGFELATVVEHGPHDDYFIRLTPTGILHIARGYAWDGPSGPAIDTKNFMRGSLVHDALYQLMREDLLDRTAWRKPADELLREICIEDGMTWLRAQWVYFAVREFAEAASRPGGGSGVMTAP